MSKKRSPGDGFGSRPKPRSGSGSSSSYVCSPVSRWWSWSAAWLRSFSNVAGAMPRHVGVRRGRAELGERRDPDAAEPRDLVAPHPGHAHEVVAVVPPLVAELLEVAEVAVAARVRLGRGSGADGVEEAVADAPVVGDEVEDAVALALAGAELDVQPLGQPAGDPLDLLGVEAELEDVLRLAVPRELRVDGLVGAVRLPLDEVGEAAPLAVDEAGLVDDVGAGAERLLRLARRPLPVPVGLDVDLDDLAPVDAELLEVAPLVLLAEPADQRALRILPLRPLQLAARDLSLELRQVRAGEIRRQVGRRDDERVVLGELHTRTSLQLECSLTREKSGSTRDDYPVGPIQRFTHSVRTRSELVRRAPPISCRLPRRFRGASLRRSCRSPSSGS